MTNNNKVRLDKLGQEISVGDVIALPTKSGGSRINDINKVVAFTPKGIKYVSYNINTEKLGDYAATSINFGQCIVVSKLLT